jgi:hypothetical protein
MILKLYSNEASFESRDKETALSISIHLPNKDMEQDAKISLRLTHIFQNHKKSLIFTGKASAYKTNYNLPQSSMNIIRNWLNSISSDVIEVLKKLHWRLENSRWTNRLRPSLMSFTVSGKRCPLEDTGPCELVTGSDQSTQDWTCAWRISTRQPNKNNPKHSTGSSEHSFGYGMRVLPLPDKHMFADLG